MYFVRVSNIVSHTKGRILRVCVCWWVYLDLEESICWRHDQAASWDRGHIKKDDIGGRITFWWLPVRDFGEFVTRVLISECMSSERYVARNVTILELSLAFLQLFPKPWKLRKIFVHNVIFFSPTFIVSFLTTYHLCTISHKAAVLKTGA